MILTSIIIPCYKRIDQTTKTISLLLSSEGLNESYQTEIIVADSSPEADLKQSLTKNFGQKVIYTRPEKPGIATNKNQGARIAKNPLLIFCDSDMEVEKNTLLNTINCIKKHATAGAVGGQVIWRTGPNDGKHDRPRTEDRMQTVNKTTYVEALYSRFLATYKEIFWKVGGYDEDVFNMRGEGSDLSVRYWRTGYPLVYDESIIVHHVHEVEGGIIRGVSHPEWGIAKDLLLLAYKYDIIDDAYKNFIHTVAANFEKFGEIGFYRIIQGVVNNYDLICKVKIHLDQQRIKMDPTYDFKFLEIFSQKDLFNLCVKKAGSKLLKIRQQCFHA